MINKQIALKGVQYSALLTGVLVTSFANASGYAINEQSASGMGNAYAGRAAMAEDASVVFYNPAALGLLSGTQVSGGLGYLNVETEFNLESATSTYGTPLQGSDGGDFVPEAYIPYIYVTQELIEQVDYGFGVYAPFGTSAEYSEDFVGAGFADETSLTAVALRGALGYQIDDSFSIGLGLDLIRMQGTLSKSVDLLHPAYGSDYLNYENHFEASGEGSGVRFDVSALYQFNNTRFGFIYRSEADITLEGQSSFRNEGVAVTAPVVLPSGDVSLLAPIPLNVADQDSEVPLTLPQSATFSLVHQIDQLQLQFGATWTDWSSFQHLKIFGTDPSTIGALAQLDAQGVQIGHVVEKWEDVWAFAAGASYQLDNQWLLRAGYAYDQSPIQDQYRTARVPSTDRQWITAGLRYSISQNLSIDSALGYLLMDNTEIDEYNYNTADQRKTTSLGNLDPANLKGEFEFSAIGFATQLNYLF